MYIHIIQNVSHLQNALFCKIQSHILLDIAFDNNQNNHYLN